MENHEWHLDKRVPISIFVVIILQTIAWAWFASAWKADLDQWRIVTSQQIALLSSQHPTTAQDVAVLKARIEVQERWQQELKNDLVRRLERQDIKLDSIASRLDVITKGGQ